MMAGLVLVLGVVSATTAKPLQDGGSDQSIEQGIPQLLELLQLLGLELHLYHNLGQYQISNAEESTLYLHRSKIPPHLV